MNRLIAFSMIILILACMAVQAELLLGLNPAGQASPPFTTITFNATITNSGSSVVYLNGIGFAWQESRLLEDSSLFCSNVPAFLAPNQSWTGDIFEVYIDANDASMDYFGRLTVMGGSDSDSQNTLNSTNFLVTVASAPAIGSIKQLPDYTAVSVRDAVVTASELESGVAFVESPNRVSGIKLLVAQSFSLGDILDFAGRVRRVDGEYLIENVSINGVGHGSELTPLFMSMRTVCNDPSEQLAYMGINTTGMLIRLAGRVTGVLSDQNAFYVSDGYAFRDGLVAYSGLRVKCPTGVALPSPGDRVVVTGISRVSMGIMPIGGEVNGYLYPAGTELFVPSLWTRQGSDLVSVE